MFKFMNSFRGHSVDFMVFVAGCQVFSLLADDVLRWLKVGIDEILFFKDVTRGLLEYLGLFDQLQVLT